MILTQGLINHLENGIANMAIKKVKKAQYGDRTFPIPSKQGYKAKVIENTTPEGTTAKVKVRRTIGGFLSGKPKGGDFQMPAYNVPQRLPRIDTPERSKGQKYNTGDSTNFKIARKGAKLTKKSIIKPKSIKKKKK